MVCVLFCLRGRAAGVIDEQRRPRRRRRRRRGGRGRGRGGEAAAAQRVQPAHAAAVVHHPRR